MLCVLNTVSHAEDAKCVSFIDDLNTFTLNCSRREFEAVPSAWPDEVLGIDNGKCLLDYRAINGKIITELAV